MMFPDDVIHKRNQSKRTVVPTYDCDSEDSAIKSDSSDLHYMQELEEKLNEDLSEYGPQRQKVLKYAKISDQQRSALIDLVATGGCTIKKAAKKLKINNSTAKAIMQVYKREGRKLKKVRREKYNKEKTSRSMKKDSTTVLNSKLTYMRSLENEKEQLNQQVIEKDHMIKSLTDQSLQLSNQISALQEQKLIYQNQLQQLQCFFGPASYGSLLFVQNQFQYYK